MTKREKLERKEQKIILKHKLKFIKVVRVWFQTRYQEMVESILDEKIQEDDALLYLREEDSIVTAIERIKSKNEELQKRKIYEAIINNDKPLLKRLLDECKTNLVLYNEELERTNKWSPYDEKDISIKNRKLKRLEKSIEDIKSLMQKLVEKSEEIKKETKKKRGRPSKSEVIQSKMENYIEEDQE